jgi:hypothetical protein
MELQKDFAELCSLFNAKGVEFLIVGGYAVAFHGAPRFTGDLDVLIRPDIEQVGRMLEALHEFGFPAHQVVAKDMLQYQSILQLGRVPVQVHLMTNLTGVTWTRRGRRVALHPMEAYRCSSSVETHLSTTSAPLAEPRTSRMPKHSKDRMGRLLNTTAVHFRHTLTQTLLAHPAETARCSECSCNRLRPWSGFRTKLDNMRRPERSSHE